MTALTTAGGKPMVPVAGGLDPERLFQLVVPDF
jgi:hypothetical protein